MVWLQVQGVGMSKKVVSYYRVSTTRQGESGLGLESQRDTVRRYVTSHGLEIVGEFTEVESGKVNDRPVIPFAKPHVLTPTEFELLLRKCQTNGWDERIVIFVLVG